MMTCQEAAQLISEERDHPLTFGQRFGLRLHLAMCALCRGYRKNLEMLGRIFARAGDAVMAGLPGTDPDAGGAALSAAARRRIQDELDRAGAAD